jgi:hypothetical protein
MNPQKSRILTAYILCSIFLCAIFFGHYIDMYFDGINYILSLLATLILVILVIVFFIKNIILIIKNRRQLTFKLYLPTIIYLTTFLLCFILPDPELFESKVIINAYYKGTQNQAYIKFRDNKTFELNWTGVFGSNDWYIGTYTKKSDTLYLKYKRLKPGRAFGTVILIKGDTLTTLDKPKDSTRYFVPFKVY